MSRELGYLTKIRERLIRQTRVPHFDEIMGLLDVADAARELAKASHVQNSDPERMEKAWNELDYALERFA